MNPRVSLLAALGVVLGLLAAAPAQAAVSVFPAPGTPTASYKTQISFRDVAPADVGTVRVTGSRSGTHRGRLLAHSDGRGASLVFSDDFRRGESVAVSTSLDVVGAKEGDYRFKVVGLGNASAIVVAPTPPSREGAGRRDRFRSRPDLAPPAVTVQRKLPGTAPGLLFVNGRNRTGQGQQGPIITDDDGEIVWFKAIGNRRKAADFRVQSYRGKPVLTWWEGAARQGGGSGENVIVDSAYKTIARLGAGNGYRSDLHEFRLTSRNTALITVYNPIVRDLSSLGGSRKGRVVDSIVQEIDIPTGLVLFEWHSLGTVGLAESYDRPNKSSAIYFDYFHLNSISEDSDGNLLISARDTWGVYKLERTTSRILWRMGGKRSSYTMGPGTRFAWQHDAERRADGTLSVFDNSAAPPVAKESRGLILKVDEAAKSVTLAKAYTHPRKLLAANQGGMETLPNGNVLVSWGSQRAFTEYTADGRMLFDARTSSANDSYRAYRSPWVGQPRTGPSLLADAQGSRTQVFASYNGATGVARWEVLAGGRTGELRPVGAEPKRGFETRLDVRATGPYFAVRALDATGKVLGTSKRERRR